jgi:hypothetical protein
MLAFLQRRPIRMWEPGILSLPKAGVEAVEQAAAVEQGLVAARVPGQAQVQGLVRVQVRDRAPVLAALAWVPGQGQDLVPGVLALEVLRDRTALVQEMEQAIAVLVRPMARATALVTAPVKAGLEWVEAGENEGA